MKSWRPCASRTCRSRPARSAASPRCPGTQFQYIVNAQGRLQTEQEFGNIVVKNGANGETTYLRDVARLELGPDNYALRSMLDGGPAVAIPVFQLPGANALQLSDCGARKTMKELAKTFPEGVSYEIDYDPTVFVRSSIEAVVHTLFEAVLLVVLVVVVFLQTWRASVIPLVAVPVAIIGTLAALLLAGFSINSLTLFGLVLATGIVVDDAIVVVENIERKIEEGLNPHAAAHAAMGEVTRPIISIMLVLCAVFVPVAFVTRPHRAVLSAIRHHHRRQHHHLDLQFPDLVAGAGGAAAEAAQLRSPMCFSAASTACWADSSACSIASSSAPRSATVMAVKRITAVRFVVLGVFVVLLVGTWGIFRMVPGGFIPAQDKQYLIGIVQLPDAASLDRTEKVVRRMSELAKETPGVDHVIGFSGLVGAGIRQSEQRRGVVLPAEVLRGAQDQGSVGGRHRRRAQSQVRQHPGRHHFRRAAAAGAGLGHHRRLQALSAGSRRAWLRRTGAGHRGGAEQGAAAARTQPVRDLHDLSEQRAAAVRRCGPRQGQAPGRAAVECVRYPAGLSGFRLRQ